MPGDLALEELAEAVGEAGESGVEMLADLAVEGSAFADEVAAMADDELQAGPGLVAFLLLEGAAGDGSAVQGSEVGVVGLDAGIDGVSILLGDEGMDAACLEAGGGEGALDDSMVATGAFDGDDAVVELVLGEGLAGEGDGVVEGGPVVRDGGGRDEDAGIEVSEEELGVSFAAVEAEDAEVIGSDLLDARVEDAARLGDRELTASRREAFAGSRRSHGSCLREKGCGSSHSRTGQSGEVLLRVKPTYQGLSAFLAIQGRRFRRCAGRDGRWNSRRRHSTASGSR